MQCINTSHPQFKNLLEQTGLHLDVLKAKVSIWMDQNNSDNFPTVEELQLAQIAEQEKTIDPLAEWLDEFDSFEPVYENIPETGLIDNFYSDAAEWEHPTDRDQTSELDDFTLFNLMNNPSVPISKENKAKLKLLSKVVGEKEAYRDYFEQNEVVRPGSVVLDKLDERYTEVPQNVFEETTEEDALLEQDLIKDIENIVRAENSKIALDKIQKMSNQLGIDVEIVSSEDLEKDFGITQTGVKAFFKNGKVYLVDGLFDENVVFHEFCHPIIKSIAKENPELFLSLYEEVLNTPEGQELFKLLSTKSTDFPVNSPEFMEEIIVKSLDEKNRIKKSTIQNILFHIKQFLRKMLGKKINISKLDANTPLIDLLDMINEGGEFILDKDFLNSSDAIMFDREYQDAVDIIAKDSVVATQLIINDYYNMISTQLGNLLKDESIYKNLKEDLTTENFDGELQVLRKMLDALTTSDKTKMANLPLSAIEKKDIELFQDRLNAFVNSLVQGGKVVEKFDKKIDDLINNGVETNDDFDALFALETYVNDWNKFITALKQSKTIIQSKTGSTPEVMLPVSYLDINNPIGLKIASLGSQINLVSEKINNLKIKSTTDLLYKNLEKRYEGISNTYLKGMQAAQDAGDLAQYDIMHEDYYGLTLEEMNEMNFLKTQPSSVERDNRLNFLNDKYLGGREAKRDAIEATLKNQLQDSTWMNGMFESYMNNQDKIVGTFADYVNTFLQDVAGNVNAIEADFLEGLRPLLKEAGFNNAIFGEAKLGKAIQHTNVTFQNDKDGNVVEFEEYAFISNFTGHEYEKAKLEQLVKRAKEKWQSTADDTDFAAYMQTEFDLEDFLIDYMHQANIPEYYKPSMVFRTPAGMQAKKMRDDIFEEMRLQRANFDKDPTSLIPADSIKKLWFEYQQLQSRYDLNGDLKTNTRVDANGNTVVTNDLAIAEVFQDYAEKTKDFHEYEEIPDLFDDQLEAFENYLINVENLTKGSLAYEQKRNDWIKFNTSVEVEEAYFDNRKALIEERQRILEYMTKVNNSIADPADLYEKIYDILRKTKDDTGDFDGNLLTKAEQKTIKKLHEEIISLEEQLYTVSAMGLTKEEYRRFNELRDYYDYYNKHRNDTTKFEYNNLEAKMRFGLFKFKISPAQFNRLQELNKELRSSVRSESTDAYINTFLEQIKKNDEAFEILNKAVYDLDGTTLEDDDPLLHEHLSKILEDVNLMNVISDKNPEFEEWFDRNHYITTIPYRDEDGNVDGEIEIYRKSAAWQFSKPSDPNMYKKKPVYSKTTGGLIGFLEVDGVFRVPNINFKKRVVKPEYQTPLIERDHVDAGGNLVLATVDNRGRFLPRENAKDTKFIDANYKQMFATNRKLFNLMLYVKNQYLNNQKGLDAPQKKYLSYPSFRRGRLEGFSTGKAFLKRTIENMTSIFGSRVDDFEEGLRMSGTDNQDVYNTLTRPISGNYKLDKDFVSLNIIKSMGLQLYSIEHFKALAKTNSFANMLKSSLEQFGLSPAVNSYRNKLKTLLRFTEKGDTVRSNRLKQVTSIIDKNFKGRQLVAVNSKTVRFANLFISRSSAVASFSAFALNITSSTKNFLGGSIMMLIKAASDPKIFNLANLTAAQVPALKAMRKIIGSSFSNKQKPVDLQLVYIMDAVPGLYERRVGGAGSRTLSKSFKSGEMLTADRRTLQDSTALLQFYAILLKNKFELNGKQTSLHKAVELVNGRIQTKAGTPKEYSISYDAEGKIILGEELKRIMNIHQGMLIKTIGQANNFSRPELFRYTLGRFAMHMMTFITGMSPDRYQMTFSKKGFKNLLKGRVNKRVNMYTQREEIGTVIAAMESIKILLQSRSFKRLPYVNQVGILATVVGLAVKIAIDTFIRKGITFNTDDDDKGLAFSYDPEDKHIYSRMNTTTGLPQLPFVSPNYTAAGNVRFDASDYWKLQGLRLALGVQQEVETFDPLNLSNTVIDLASLKSPLQEGGLLKFVDLIEYTTGEPDTYEKEAGPLIWQQKYEDKYKNIFFKLLGINGKEMSPAYGIEQDYKGINKK